jgi:alpha 1,2-mannosyltransferase
VSNNKKVIASKEHTDSLSLSLFCRLSEWRRENPSMLAVNDSLSFVSDDGMGYNMCHYWSNFEIIDLSFTRSPAYTSYFTTLDKAGGFFYERWGDAPVRSIAASMMLNSNELWQIDYAGYVRSHSRLKRETWQLIPFYRSDSSIRRSANALAD